MQIACCALHPTAAIFECVRRCWQVRCANTRKSLCSHDRTFFAAGPGGIFGLDPSIEHVLLRLAEQEPTPVALPDLFKFGMRGTDDAARLENAQFLHRELAIRTAQA